MLAALRNWVVQKLLINHSQGTLEKKHLNEM